MPKTASILIVDDDTDIATNVTDILNDCGYHVDCAHNGPEAIGLARARAYDMVILDYKMPGMDGAEVYRQIRQIQPATVAVMVTAFAGDRGVQEAVDAGTWRVLRKPMNVGELLQLIEIALQQKQILLVDDDEEFCASIWDTLRERGFRVGLVHDVTSAKRELGSRDYDVVLLDLRLGEVSAEELLTNLNAAPDAPRVIVVTGLDHNDQLVQQLSDRGVDNIYFKPLAIDEMINSLS